MPKDVLREMVVQNQFTSHFCFDRVTDGNASLRLTDKAASIGFIFRHIGETMNLLAQMLGTPTDVKNTTIGQVDTGERYVSRRQAVSALAAMCFAVLRESTPFGANNCAARFPQLPHRGNQNFAATARAIRVSTASCRAGSENAVDADHEGRVPSLHKQRHAIAQGRCIFARQSYLRQLAAFASLAFSSSRA
jgi:hypothetical protein